MRKRVNCRSSIACVVVVRLKDIGESGGSAVVSPTVMLQELRSRETDHCVKRDDFRDYVEASAKVQCTTQHRTSPPCSLTLPLLVCAVQAPLGCQVLESRATSHTNQAYTPRSSSLTTLLNGQHGPLYRFFFPFFFPFLPFRFPVCLLPACLSDSAAATPPGGGGGGGAETAAVAVAVAAVEAACRASRLDLRDKRASISVIDSDTSLSPKLHTSIATQQHRCKESETKSHRGGAATYMSFSVTLACLMNRSLCTALPALEAT